MIFPKEGLGFQMRTYQAIEQITSQAIADGLCRAAYLQGSIGRGEDDEFSDIDLYLVTQPEHIQQTFNRLHDYCLAYGPIILFEEVNFGLPQKVVLFEDGLHADIFVLSPEQIHGGDQIKIWHDPDGLLDGYRVQPREISDAFLAEVFSDALFAITEAEVALRRDNRAWATKLFADVISRAAVLLRYQYDPEHAFLGLKGFNRVIPEAKYRDFEEAFARLGAGDFQSVIGFIFEVLDGFVESCGDDTREGLNLGFYRWAKLRYPASL